MMRTLAIFCVTLGSAELARGATIPRPVHGPISEIAKCMVDVLREIPSAQSVIVGRFGENVFYLDYVFLDAAGRRQWNRLPVELSEDGSWRYFMNDFTDDESDPGKKAGADWVRRCQVNEIAILGPVLQGPSGEQPWHNGY